MFILVELILVNLLFCCSGFEIVDWFYNCFTTLVPNIIMVILCDLTVS